MLDAAYLDAVIADGFEECGRSGKVYGKEGTASFLLACDGDRYIAIDNFRRREVGDGAYLANLGLVGESGSGKSTVLRAIAGLLGRSGRIDAGSVLYGARDLTATSAREMAALRGADIAYVFQDPVASLDPLFTIGSQFDECIRAHGTAHGDAVRALERDLLDEMGFDDPDRVLAARPHNLSGGMCQRVVLAFSLACDPKLLLADEPTSALDVAAQEQVSRLLLRIREERGVAILVVSHNIGAIARVADRIGVMFRGRLVELGPCDQVLHAPGHPYTRNLIAAVPKADGSLPAMPEPWGEG